MANTYSQIYIQIVFAVKGREHLIHNQDREGLQKYITGILQAREERMYGNDLGRSYGALCYGWVFFLQTDCSSGANLISKR